MMQFYFILYYFISNLTFKRNKNFQSCYEDTHILKIKIVIFLESLNNNNYDFGFFNSLN